MKNIKILLMGIISVIIICAMTFIGIYMTFWHISKWKYCVENFENYKTDFEAMSSYCLEYNKKSTLSVGRTIFDYGSSENDLFYNGKWLNVSDDKVLNLSKISEAFPNKDAQFDCIICEGETVYFTTHNGLYSVVYSADKPESVDGKHDGCSKRIQKNWYHVVKK